MSAKSGERPFTSPPIADTIVAMPRHLSLPTVLFMVLALPAMASAENRAKVSPAELARALNHTDGRVDPYLKVKISPSEIRVIECVGPDEEPTEFECSWRQREGRGWVRRSNWLAIDGSGWHVID